MSAHYSKYDLYTFATTPYFRANIPGDYPLAEVLVNARAHRRLPPNLRELSAKARAWAVKNYGIPSGIPGIERWYDVAGNELDPGTGKRLTDSEIDAEWEKMGTPAARGPGKDIPVPRGGFPDPDTWQEPKLPPDRVVDPDAPTETSLLRDIKSHGHDYVAGYYGVQSEKTDTALVQSILQRLSGAAPTPS